MKLNETENVTNQYYKLDLNFCAFIENLNVWNIRDKSYKIFKVEYILWYLKDDFYLNSVHKSLSCVS